MNEGYFYDIHMHTLNAGHANLAAFFERFYRRGVSQLIIDAARSFTKGLFSKEEERRGGAPLQRAANFLRFMDSSVRYDYLFMEYYMRKKGRFIKGDGSFPLLGETFRKIVLCPLMMDFNCKDRVHHTAYYKFPSMKPIEEQMRDLFEAIRFYYAHEVCQTGERIDEFEVRPCGKPREERFFEVYPFLGINTQTYSLSELQALLERYFSDFTGDDGREARYGMLYRAAGRLCAGELREETGGPLFAGIKVYPPLGFDPWPRQAEEKEKVRCLYEYCTAKRIPITTHCSRGGFRTSDKPEKLTDPRGPWAKVLARYPGLTLNFAHFGKDEEWDKGVIKHVTNHPRVFADISCNDGSAGYYKELYKKMKLNKWLRKGLLFGSDFALNLLDHKSYDDYIRRFATQAKRYDDLKLPMATANPERFLFGEA